MKKVFIIIMSFVILLSVSSCSAVPTNEEKLLTSIVKNIEDCINSQDTEQLKTLFSSSATDTEKFEETGENLIGHFRGKNVYATLINHSFEGVVENGKTCSTYFCTITLTTANDTFFGAFSYINDGKKNDYKIKSFFIIDSDEYFDDALYYGGVYDTSKCGIYFENACSNMLDSFVAALNSSESEKLEELFAVNIYENKDYGIDSKCTDLTELFNGGHLSYEINEYRCHRKSETVKKESRYVEKISCEVTVYCTLKNGDNLYESIMVFSPVNQKKLGMVGINSVLISQNDSLQGIYNNEEEIALGIHTQIT